LQRLQEILAILQQLSIIGGICYAVVLSLNQYRSTLIARDSYKLNRWKEIRAFLDVDYAVRKKIVVFLKKMDEDPRLAPAGLAKRYSTGMRAYFSDELEEFQTIARHYEQMGAFLRREYLPLDLLNTVIPFPDEFWDRTEDLRGHIKENWFGPGERLSSFLDNFLWMRERWHALRVYDESGSFRPEEPSPPTRKGLMQHP
jgi:hypothetical protein